MQGVLEIADDVFAKDGGGTNRNCHLQRGRYRCYRSLIMPLKTTSSGDPVVGAATKLGAWTLRPHDAQNRCCSGQHLSHVRHTLCKHWRSISNSPKPRTAGNAHVVGALCVAIPVSTSLSPFSTSTARLVTLYEPTCSTHTSGETKHQAGFNYTLVAPLHPQRTTLSLRPTAPISLSVITICTSVGLSVWKRSRVSTGTADDRPGEYDTAEESPEGLKHSRTSSGKESQEKKPLWE